MSKRCYLARSPVPPHAALHMVSGHCDPLRAKGWAPGQPQACWEGKSCFAGALSWCSLLAADKMAWERQWKKYLKCKGLPQSCSHIQESSTPHIKGSLSTSAGRWTCISHMCKCPLFACLTSFSKAFQASGKVHVFVLLCVWVRHNSWALRRVAPFSPLRCALWDVLAGMFSCHRAEWAGCFQPWWFTSFCFRNVYPTLPRDLGKHTGYFPTGIVSMPMGFTKPAHLAFPSFCCRISMWNIKWAGIRTESPFPSMSGHGYKAGCALHVPGAGPTTPQHGSAQHSTAGEPSGGECRRGSTCSIMPSIITARQAGDLQAVFFFFHCALASHPHEISKGNENVKPERWQVKLAAVSSCPQSAVPSLPPASTSPHARLILI